LEDSEDCRGAGGHGNQHVRLRSAQIDCIETICPALAAPRCFEPRQRPIQDFRFKSSGHGFKASPDLKASPENQRIPQAPLHRKTCRSANAVQAFAEEALSFDLPLKSIVVAVAPRALTLQGRPAGSNAALDLVNFERHQARLVFGVNF
jgi:hypothetical protein